MSDKPVLVFFKMFNCGHCTSFAEKPTAEGSEWAQMLRDPEFQASVDFVRYDFGIETKGGQTVRHKLPDQYSFVNYGPYFYLHQPDSVENGLEFNPAAAQKYGRTAKGLKSWVKDSLKTDPKLNAHRRAQVTSVPVPVATPKADSSGFASQKPALNTPPPQVAAPNLVPNPASRVRSARGKIRVPAAQEIVPQNIRARNRRRK